jgi:putative PIN family toxin of toxin-antitoxin system
MRRTKRVRIVLDTNFWISYLISDRIKSFDKYLFSKEAQIVFSTELLEEFLVVSQREKFSKFFPHSDVEKLMGLINDYGVIVKVKSNQEICRDPKDNFLLNLALDAKADYLVTGDNDLLVIETIGRTKIITLKDLEILFSEK